jgi:hypothetical protein
MKRRLFAMFLEILLVEHAAGAVSYREDCWKGEAGCVLTGAYITILNRDTELSRTNVTRPQGTYSATPSRWDAIKS